MDRNVRVALIVGATTAILLVALPLILGGFNNWYTGGCFMNWPWMMGGYGWWGWWMMIPMLLFWGLGIWGVVYLVSRLASPGATNAPRETGSALEVLKVRYARGEITKKEYEEKRRDLE